MSLPARQRVCFPLGVLRAIYGSRGDKKVSSESMSPRIAKDIIRTARKPATDGAKRQLSIWRTAYSRVWCLGADFQVIINCFIM